MDAHANQGKVVEYFMMFPLDSPQNSKNASQAAIAANQMGKFKEMHKLLFERSPAHTKEAVIGYAKEIGLDPAAFEAAYDAAAAHVAADVGQGDSVGVQATPTMSLNDRNYDGTLPRKYL